MKMLCQLSLVAAVLMLVAAGDSKPFKLTVTPAEVNRFTTKGMSVKCARDLAVEAQVATISRVRIVKKSETGWDMVAEQRDFEETANAGSLHASSKINGDVSEAYLEVMWDEVTDDNFGVYKCEMIGFDADNKAAIDRSAELDLQEADVPDEYFAKLSEETQEELSELKEKTDQDLPRLKQQFQELEQACSALEARLNSLTQWPAGFYGLLAPRDGCPVDLSFFSGTHKFHHLQAEKVDTNETSAVSEAFSTQTLFGKSKKMVTMELCETSRQFSTAAWPKGQYCIHKIIGKDCPSGFEIGSVFVDTESWKPSGFGRNNIMNRGNDPTIGFCCQKEGSATDAIQLPTADPFMLYRVGGSCQAVQGMTVSEEFLQINTDDQNNKDSFEGSLPSIAHPGTIIKFNLCYYTKE